MLKFRIRRISPLVFALAIATVGLATATTGYASTSPRPAPKAVIPFTSFTFGDVYRGEVISQIFVIKNEGDVPLEISDFKATCGCEVTRTDRVIPAGKEGTATLEVMTVSLSGEISRNATLYTNDPAKPAIIFTLVANVINGASGRRGKYIGPIFVSPETNYALYSAPNKKATAEFSLTAENAPVKILRVEGGEKHFVTRVVVVEEGRNYKILVESLPLDAAGLYTDKLRVTTDNASLPAFTLDLVFRVYPKE